MKTNLWAIPLLAVLPLCACTPSEFPPSVPCEHPSCQPQNASPPHRSLVDSGQPTLEWTYHGPQNCYARHFDVQVFTNSTEGVLEDTGMGGDTQSSAKQWSPPADLVPGTRYVWRVAARNSSTFGPYSEWTEFIAGPVCGGEELVAPQPLEPTSGGAVSTLQPTFTWDYPGASCAPEGYHVQVSTDADFNALVIDSRQAYPYREFNEWAQVSPLQTCTSYYWRVAASAGDEDGPWSSTSNFALTVQRCTCAAPYLESLPPELQPIPVSPAMYEIVDAAQVSLQWEYLGSCAMQGFAVHLSPDPDMADLSLSGGTGTPDTQWGPGSPLPPATQWWWQVAGRVGDQLGPFSEKRSFFTGPECSGPSALVPPQLISPSEGQEVATRQVALRFRPGDPGCIPDGYLLDLQTDPTFAGSNLLGTFDIPANTVLTDPLADCTLYYWRVAAIQDGVVGPASQRGSFFTNLLGTCAAPPQFATAWPAERDLACLAGPDSKRYPRTGGFVLQGERTQIFGRNMRGDFIIVQDPDNIQGIRCYLRTTEVELSVALEDLRILNDPPVPTPTPEQQGPVCHRDIATRAECDAAGGVWTRPPTGGDYYCKCNRTWQVRDPRSRMMALTQKQPAAGENGADRGRSRQGGVSEKLAPDHLRGPHRHTRPLCLHRPGRSPAIQPRHLSPGSAPWPDCFPTSHAAPICPRGQSMADSPLTVQAARHTSCACRCCSCPARRRAPAGAHSAVRRQPNGAAGRDTPRSLVWRRE